MSRFLIIPNRELRVVDLPAPDDERREGWEELALTFPGYAFSANSTKQALAEWVTGELSPASLTDLRSWLFFEQRQENQTEMVSDWPWVEYLLDGIRGALLTGATQDDPLWDRSWETQPATTHSAGLNDWPVAQHRLEERFGLQLVDESKQQQLAIGEREGRSYVLRRSAGSAGAWRSRWEIMPFRDRTEAERFLSREASL